MTDKSLTLIDGGREVEQYNPGEGLQTIAVAEAAEKHWRRAKDADQLYKAIEAKLLAQAQYVVWRDNVVTPSREHGGPGRGKRVAVLGPVLPEAQKTVRALQYFTEKDDGLAQEWNGRVFLNPPYHRDLAPKFIDKLVAELTAGRVIAAILLTNNCTDTKWFDVAVRACAGICFTHGRIPFHVPKCEDVLPNQGQSFLYFGEDVQRFEDVFCLIGFCVRLSRQYELRDGVAGEGAR